jgi:hypothetical protein
MHEWFFSEESTSKGSIIGAIIAAVAALAGLIAYSLWRKKFKPSNQVILETLHRCYNT